MGTITPATLSDDKGNLADKNSNITWAALPTGSSYSSDNTANDGGLRPLYEMARKFLDVVQPNPFPYGKSIPVYSFMLMLLF
jgi:hypothetical protein